MHLKTTGENRETLNRLKVEMEGLFGRVTIGCPAGCLSGKTPSSVPVSPPPSSDSTLSVNPISPLFCGNGPACGLAPSSSNVLDIDGSALDAIFFKQRVDFLHRARTIGRLERVKEGTLAAVRHQRRRQDRGCWQVVATLRSKSYCTFHSFAYIIPVTVSKKI